MTKHDNGWREISKKITSRDQICLKCGRKTKLHVHHLIPRREGGYDIAENLASLCPSCHRKVENDYRRYGMTRYMRDLICQPHPQPNRV